MERDHWRLSGQVSLECCRHKLYVVFHFYHSVEVVVSAVIHKSSYQTDLLFLFKIKILIKFLHNDESWGFWFFILSYLWSLLGSAQQLFFLLAYPKQVLKEMFGRSLLLFWTFGVAFVMIYDFYCLSFQITPRLGIIVLLSKYIVFLQTVTFREFLDS